MAKYRNSLPQLSNKLFLTDGGLETTLIFQDDFDLPEFAAFPLLHQIHGYKILERYYRLYAKHARDNAMGFILESMTWRASSEWGQRLGYNDDALAKSNRRAIELLASIRTTFETADSPMVISGCIGPRGDGYNPCAIMSTEEAEHYHRPQIETFASTEADMVSALTMNYAEEAIGLTNVAKQVGIPMVISFTIDIEGRLPSGDSLAEAIERVDAATDAAPVYYMINCAHPAHLEDKLLCDDACLKRIKGIRTNASAMSHTGMDAVEALDTGDPVELAQQYRRLRDHQAQINILGCCCDTDHRHLLEICKACRD